MGKKQKALTTKLGQFVAEHEGLLRGLRLISVIGGDLLTEGMRSVLSDSPDDFAVPGRLAQQAKVSEEAFREAGTAASLLLGFGFEERERESFQEILTDLTEGGILENDVAKAVAATLETLSAQTDLMAKTDEKMKATAALISVFPRLLGIWMRCVLVPRFEPEYDPDQQKPEEYTGRPQEPCHALAIQIDIDVFGSKKRFSFAIEQRRLELLIRELQAARKQLAMLRETPGPS